MTPDGETRGTTTWEAHADPLRAVAESLAFGALAAVIGALGAFILLAAVGLQGPPLFLSVGFVLSVLIWGVTLCTLGESVRRLLNARARYLVTPEGLFVERGLNRRRFVRRRCGVSLTVRSVDELAAELVELGPDGRVVDPAALPFEFVGLGPRRGEALRALEEVSRQHTTATVDAAPRSTGPRALLPSRRFRICILVAALGLTTYEVSIPPRNHIHHSTPEVFWKFALGVDLDRATVLPFTEHFVTDSGEFFAYRRMRCGNCGFWVQRVSESKAFSRAARVRELLDAASHGRDSLALDANVAKALHELGDSKEIDLARLLEQVQALEDAEDPDAEGVARIFEIAFLNGVVILAVMPWTARRVRPVLAGLAAGVSVVVVLMPYWLGYARAGSWFDGGGGIFYPDVVLELTPLSVLRNDVDATLLAHVPRVLEPLSLVSNTEPAFVGPLGALIGGALLGIVVALGAVWFNRSQEGVRFERSDRDGRPIA